MSFSRITNVIWSSVKDYRIYSSCPDCLLRPCLRKNILKASKLQSTPLLTSISIHLWIPNLPKSSTVSPKMLCTAFCPCTLLPCWKLEKRKRLQSRISFANLELNEISAATKDFGTFFWQKLFCIVRLFTLLVNLHFHLAVVNTISCVH